jgi:hypothetical protein
MSTSRVVSNWPAPVKVKADGCCLARCPACACRGQDTKGDHLWWNPDTGAFNCIAYPGDAGHRREIIELAGRLSGKAKVSEAQKYRPINLSPPVWNGFK